MFLEWENNSEKLQIISGKFQKNAIKDVKQISLSHVITCWMQVNQIAKIHLKLEAKIGDSLLYNASDCAKKETLMTRFLLKITLLPTKMGNLNDTHRGKLLKQFNTRICSFGRLLITGCTNDENSIDF